MTSAAPGWLSDAVAEFGSACRNKLAGPGDREAAIRSPLEGLLGAVGSHLEIPAVFHDEVRDTARQVRPDYGVSVGGTVIGYIEVKAPGKPIDPARLRSHDKQQWERQQDLPNLLYTNGTEWRLYQDGEPWGEPLHFAGGGLAVAGAGLEAPAQFEFLMATFLRWKPNPITSVGALVRAVAPLTRLLRGEVLDQLKAEQRAVDGGANKDDQPFLGLAQDWRMLLFPQADDATFADGYAQTVTFALLLARTEGIAIAGSSLHEVGKALGPEHSLMGRALQLLTSDVAADFVVTLDLLARVVDVVDWPQVRRAQRDTYLHLYEHFLEEYDNDLRKLSGSYYTPREVVDFMVRLTEEALVTRLDKADGFRDDEVTTIDPAMGTGTYLHAILEHVASEIEGHEGPGAVPGEVQRAAERLVGFELQMGPYAVAELRTADLLKKHRAVPPPNGMRLYVTDTLDDPYAAQTQLASGLRLIAQQRKKANEIKAKAAVTVVIGNPPYRERAEGRGGWVESGSKAEGKKPRAILEDFREADNGLFEYTLKNLYVYFWRWATWKVWESTPADPDGDAGIVCFITTSGYLRGPGFKGMRRYLRKWASEGWIIDVTPEGQTPDVPTRIFPGVRQPLAIGLFVRKADTSADIPATIRFRSVAGRQAQKFDALKAITLDGAGWHSARTDWTAPLTPAADGAWDQHPAMDDLFPWLAPGVKPNRTWVYAPARSILDERWRQIIGASTREEKAHLFKEGRDAHLDRVKQPLPGAGTHRSSGPFAAETGLPPAALRIAYRAFDRQWIIPDSRLMDTERPQLWEARLPGQVFVVEQHSKPISSGPGLLFTTLIPDMDHFNNRGGRTLPFLHPDGSANLAPGFLSALSSILGGGISAAQVLAYIAGVVAHPSYTRTFTNELTTPGIRVPVTSDAELFAEAAELGEQVLWLHTYGTAVPGVDRPEGNVRYPAGDERRPLALTPITEMPETMDYHEDRRILRIGAGEFGPVPPAVWAYDVGGKNVVKSWFNYRKASPGGKKTSPLDNIHVHQWPAEWTSELLDLLSVLGRLVELEPRQADLLDKILQGPLLTRTELATMGVSWPTNRNDRKPRRGLSPTDDSTEMTLL
ncbi:type ISP restriction/modification enzyme [Nocardia donostiensis]|uniref:site-specific DNA-methyltransferase (adenine-specific) n=1 Tax=Nocardia donostiensis TaxID=1538463 RepID=A0A1V2TJD1_9NOCA|nr:type ISP restriction/modification enzyme [Nocardia donostiensis]ONM49578.1 hypothetical protein B0T46_06950 [Nocardia donostiensis]OQS19199.1 hypothetical protein B0T44_15240 [Nocardia donostiensis]